MKVSVFFLSLVVAFGLGFISSSQPAKAAILFCSQPYAPTAYLSKPSKPYCLTFGQCERWEIDNYRSEVDRYFRSLSQYADEVDNYYADAVQYVRCMSDLD